LLVLSSYRNLGFQVPTLRITKYRYPSKGSYPQAFESGISSEKTSRNAVKMAFSREFFPESRTNRGLSKTRDDLLCLTLKDKSDAIFRDDIKKTLDPGLRRGDRIAKLAYARKAILVTSDA
jgi:hypothetical protein